MEQNTLAGFEQFAQTKGVTLTPVQAGIAASLFAMPAASGKSLLVALLASYDIAAPIYMGDLG